MAKVTIYLPDSLEEAVRAADISMSPICQHALQEEVRKVEAVKNATRDIERVASRLRGTIEEEAVEDRKEGFEWGADWARDIATFSELEAVVSRTYAEWWDNGPGGFIATSFEGVVEYLNSGDDGAFARKLDQEPFVRGFVEGAETVYNEVRPLL